MERAKKITEKNGVCTLTALFCAVCILFGAVFAANVRADEDALFFPTLYCNDEVWYKADIYPLDRYFLTYYVPAAIFGRFDGVSITYNERFGTLLISRSGGHAGFVSFNLVTDLAFTNEKGEFEAMIYTKDDERYVPLEVVCEALGFSFEYYRSERLGISAARICDGNEKKSFSELIELFATDEHMETTTALPPETSTPPAVDPPVPADAKTLYLTFDSLDMSEIDRILATLKEHKAKATFFFGSDEQNEHPDALIKIAAAGHSIGLAFDVSGFEADVDSAFAAQNETLMRYIKHESRFVRIYGRDDTNDMQKRAADLEYAVWGWDAAIPGGYADNWTSVAHELADAAKQNDVLTVRFYQRNVYRMLDGVLSILEQEGNYTTKTINDATRNKE